MSPIRGYPDSLWERSENVRIFLKKELAVIISIIVKDTETWYFPIQYSRFQILKNNPQIP